MITPDARQELFRRVFDNVHGEAVLQYLAELYDVGVMPASSEAEYVKTCKRSVIKQIRAFMNKK